MIGLLPIINIICGIIVLICLALCLLAQYEFIPSYWFMVGLIGGITLFFGTISANIYLYQLEKRYNDAMTWGNNASNGKISLQTNNGSSVTDTYMDIPNGTFTNITSAGKNNAYDSISFANGYLNSSSLAGKNKSSRSQSLNINAIGSLLTS